MRTYTYTVTDAENEMKILDFLRGKQYFSRGLIIRLKQVPDGILKNGVHARTVDRLAVGDVLTINLYDKNPKEIIAFHTGLEPVYEDEDMLVFDKPPFMLVHQSHWHQADTLANVYAAWCLQKGVSVSSFRSVNRLDKDTSGLVAVAKNSRAAAFLSGQMKKEYLAVAEGVLQKKAGIIDAPVDRERPGTTRRCVREDGQRAVTEYEVLRQSKTHALVLCRLITGRTHQIRVHFSYLGHPLAGDVLYGGSPNYINRQALHCAKLIFSSISRDTPVTVTAEAPWDMQSLYQSTGLTR